MDKVTKWLLKYDSQNNLVITPHDIPMMFPINKIIGKRGLYTPDLVKIDEVEYLCTFDEVTRDCVLVSKVNPNGNQPGFMNLTERDENNMTIIAEKLLKKVPTTIQ